MGNIHVCLKYSHLFEELNTLEQQKIINEIIRWRIYFSPMQPNRYNLLAGLLNIKDEETAFLNVGAY